MRNPVATLALLPLLVACKLDKENEDAIAKENHAPVADAGTAISQTADTPVNLDGGGSYDPDGDAIEFHWAFDTVPNGSALSGEESPFPGNDTTSTTTKFWADTAGTYVVSLVVTDSKGLQSEPDFVVIEITEGDPPVADAGPDLEGTEGDTFTLDGSNSWDPLGRDLSYEWTFASVPSLSSLTGLTGSDSSMASFVADVGGVYIASLVVTNGIANSEADTVIVRVSSANPQAPVAIAGDDITDYDCTAIDLDGSGSYDPNNEDLSYQWGVQVIPEGSSAGNTSFGDRFAAKTTFMADVAGTYVVALSVYDGTEWSTPDLLTLELSERSYNSTPVVDAGSRKAVDAGEGTCEEDGYTYDCESCANQTVDLGDDATVTDADGDALTYLWSTDNENASIDDPSSLQTTVTLSDLTPTEPSVCDEEDFQFTLTVTDCTGETAVDTVTFTTSCCGVADTGARR